MKDNLDMWYEGAARMGKFQPWGPKLLRTFSWKGRKYGGVSAPVAETLSHAGGGDFV